LSDNGPAGPFTVAAGRLPNLGNYSLKAPEHVSDNCMMKATVYDQDWVESSCVGGTFSIARRLELNATYPFSDGQVPGGTSVDITWTSEGGHGTASVTIFFWPNASSAAEAVASGLPPSGSYRWTAPEMNCDGAILVLNATDDWNRSVEAASDEFMVRSSKPPPPPPQPPAPTGPNRPPVIRFDLLQSKVVVNDPASFDASGSFDPDGDALYYRWDFGDGSGIVNITAPKTTHSFPYAGTYNVMLVAGDGRSETSQAMAILVSPPTPPSAPSTGGDWQTASLGIVIIIIGSVGIAYSAASRHSSRRSNTLETSPAAGATPEQPPAESQAEAAARAYAVLYGAPPPDLQASAQAPLSPTGTAQPPVGAEPPFPLLLDTTRCVGCGTCAMSCPFQAITMVGDRPMLDCPRCTGCGHCIGNCAQGALSMNPAFTDSKAV
jgi:ferredoxin